MMNLKTLPLYLSLVFISSTSQAVPFLYIFGGEITSIVSRIDGVLQTGATININGTDFSRGGSVSYRFIADTSVDGFCSAISPTTSTNFCGYPNGIPTLQPGVDHFYSELLPSSTSVSYNWSNTTINYGLRQPSAFLSELNGGSGVTVKTHPLLAPINWDILLWDSINSPLTTIPAFLEGEDNWDETIAGINYSGNIKSFLTLQSAVALVPTPSTLFLFSIALLIPLVSRKQKGT